MTIEVTGVPHGGFRIGDDFDHAGITWRVVSLEEDWDQERDEYVQRASAIALKYLPIPYTLID